MKNLRLLREQKKQTQRSLSMAVGIQQTRISEYETGKASPTSDHLQLLADYYQCSTDFLLDRTEVRHPVQRLLEKQLSMEEAELIVAFRGLSQNRRGRLMGYLQCLLDELEA